MVLFQILGSAVLLGFVGVSAYNMFKNRFIIEMRDSRGVVRKRDVRNGRFVK
jgi:hypothetical protein